ncbi:uncharacterized protein V6R79_008094 [Siganus canaliculatus]
MGEEICGRLSTQAPTLLLRCLPSVPKNSKKLGWRKDRIRSEGEISAAASSLLTDGTYESSVLKGWIFTGSPENRVWSHTEVWILAVCKHRRELKYGLGFSETDSASF